jgi:hypothetical protein
MRKELTSQLLLLGQPTLQVVVDFPLSQRIHLQLGFVIKIGEERKAKKP